MNPTTTTPLLVRLVKSLAIVVVDVPSRPAKPSRRKSARTTVLAFAFVLLASNFGLSFSMDSLFAQLRDPEYGRRLSHCGAAGVAAACKLDHGAVVVKAPKALKRRRSLRRTRLPYRAAKRRPKQAADCGRRKGGFVHRTEGRRRYGCTACSRR